MLHKVKVRMVAGIGALLAVPCTCAVAQDPDIVWQTSLGGTGNEERCFDLLSLPPDRYMLVGQANSYDGDVIGHHGAGDGWLAQIDLFGGLVWNRCYGGSGQDALRRCQRTPDGGFIAVGYSSLADGDIEEANGLHDMWALKLDAAGNVQWSRSFGGSGDDEGSDVALCADGGYIIAGSSWSSDGDALNHHGAASEADVFVARLDANGDPLWVRSYGGTGTDGGSAVFSMRVSVATHDGVHFNVVAYTDSDDGDVTYSPLHTLDVWHLRIDDTGSILWDRCYGGSNYEIPYAIATTPDGGHVLVASTRSANYDVTDYLGDSDSWVVKVDSVGDIEWDATVGTTAYDDPASIAQLLDGTFLVAGRSGGSLPGEPNQGANDMHVAHLSPDGDVLRQRFFGGSVSDEGRYAIEGPSGGVLLAGHTASDDGDILFQHDGYDIWVAYMVNALGEEGPVALPATQLYPNPCDQQFFLRYPPEGYADAIAVVDHMGREVLRRAIDQGIQQDVAINASTLPTGMYLVRCTGSRGAVALPVVVEH